MKTTVNIPDPLFREIRQWTARHRMTLKELIEAALRAFLQSRPSRARRFSLRKHVFRGQGLAPDLTAGDWGAVRARIYDGHGG